MERIRKKLTRNNIEIVLINIVIIGIISIILFTAPLINHILVGREYQFIENEITNCLESSCVIEDKYTELAVRVLHDAFELGSDKE